MSHLVEVVFADPLLVAQKRVTVVDARIASIGILLFDGTTCR